MDEVVSAIREHEDFILQCDGSEEPAHISGAVVALMALMKQLIAMATSTDEMVAVYRCHEGIITADLKELTSKTKSLNSEGVAVLPTLQAAMQIFKAHVDQLITGLYDPGAATPPEYTSFFEKAVGVIRLIIQTIETSWSQPARVQEEVVPVVGAFKELIAVWWESPLLRLILEDQKAVFLANLARLVKEAQAITGRDTPVEDRAAYMRTLSAMVEVLRDWVGNRFGLTLEHATRVVLKVKHNCIDALYASLQLSLPSGEVDTSGLGSDDRNFKTVSNVPKRQPPKVIDVFARNPTVAAPPGTGATTTSQPLTPSSNGGATPSGRESPAQAEQQHLQQPEQQQPQYPTAPKTKKVSVAGMEVVLSAGSVRNSVKWNDANYNWSTLKKYNGLFFAVASRDYESEELGTKLTFLSFKQGALIAVQNNSSPSYWEGANVDTGLAGVFPRHHVEVIADSFQLFLEGEKEDVPLKEDKGPTQNPVLTTKALVKVGGSKIWNNTTMILNDLKLDIAAGKPETGTLRKKKKPDTHLPVTLNLPDCTVSPVMCEGLDKKYAERAIQVQDRLTSVTYLLAIEPIEVRGDWTKALTLASLTIPPAEATVSKAGSKKSDLPTRSRSLSLFGAKRSHPPKPANISTNTSPTGSTPASPASPPRSPGSPSPSSSSNLSSPSSSSGFHSSSFASDRTVSPEPTSPKEANEKPRRRNTLLDRLRPRSDSFV